MNEPDLIAQMLQIARDGLPPNATPQEVFAEWQALNLAGIEAGWLIAILRADNDILYRHRDNCTPAELAVAMTPTQYRLIMER